MRTLAQRDRRGVERVREEKELTYLIQINHNAAANSISGLVFALAPDRDADQQRAKEGKSLLRAGNIKVIIFSATIMQETLKNEFVTSILSE
jgi:hypothetical protein